MPITPGRPVALRRPSPGPRPPPLLRGPRGSRRRRRGGQHDRRHPARRRRPDGPRHGPGLRRRAAALARRIPAGLARMGPPGHALGCDAAARRRVRARRDPRTRDPGRRRPGRIDRPARVGARRHAPPHQRPERLVEPLPARRRPAARAARADGGGVRRSGLDLRPLVLRVPARRRDRRRRARRRSRPPVPDRARPAHRRGRAAVHRARCAAGRSRTVVALAGAPGDPSVVARFDPVTLAPAGVLRRASTITFDPAIISRPESIEFPTTGGRTAHALYYPPTNPDFAGPDGEKPPLIVLSHGGPTSNASTALDLVKQLLTSRGIAVVDVDYGGSTGYGREYRQRLDGQWGIVDVDDCVAAARFLVERGDVDPARLAIEGGSAGGYTTLAALAFRDVFAAGISQYGIGDLELLEVATHKFESRYSHRLVGPYPEQADVYRERSPNNFPDAFSSPVLILQGLDDRVVPPAQAEAIVAALAAKGIPYAYLAFEGEGHGFRGAYAIRRTLEAQLSFLGQVFGFEPADAIEPLEMPGLDAWRASHPRPVVASVPPVGRRRTARSPAPPDGVRAHRAGPRPVRRRRRPRLPRPAGRRRLPDPAGLRRARARVRSRPAGDRAPAGPRLPAAAAAHPVRGRLLDPRSATSRRTPGRSRCSPSGSCCSRRSWSGPWSTTSSRGWGCSRRSRWAPSSPRPTRWPRPRSSGGSAPPRRIVTILEGESLLNDASALIAYRFAIAAAVTGLFSPAEAVPRVPVRGAGRRRGRRRGRRPGHRGVAADVRPDPRDHGLAAGALRGLPPGRGDGHERRARGRGRRPHRRSRRRPRPVARRPPDGPRGVGDRDLHDQRHRVHPDRPPAAVDRGAPHDGERAGAHRARPGHQPDRHRRAHRVGLPGDLPAALAERPDPGARPGSAAGRRVRRLVGGDARRGLAGGGAGPAARPGGLPRSAT